jgi:hypothetical protein
MKTENRFAICVQNEGYPASLELWKIYRVLPDKKAAEHGANIPEMLGKSCRAQGFRFQ